MLLLPFWYLIFLLSLTCHEAAHALVAYVGGDRTAYLGGQVSLNPIPHVQREPVGAILVPLLTYFYMGWTMGWASAPYDPEWEDRYPKRAAVMALAGPMANLGLLVLAFVVLRSGIVMEVWTMPESITMDRLVVPLAENASLLEGVGRLFSVMLILNLVLFLFNLIPLPPLDGASVLAGFFEPARRMTDWLRGSPMGGWIGILAAWMIFPYVFLPVVGWLLARLDAG